MVTESDRIFGSSEWILIWNDCTHTLIPFQGILLNRIKAAILYRNLYGVFQIDIQSKWQSVWRFILYNIHDQENEFLIKFRREILNFELKSVYTVYVMIKPKNYYKIFQFI